MNWIRGCTGIMWWILASERIRGVETLRSMDHENGLWKGMSGGEDWNYAIEKEL